MASSGSVSISRTKQPSIFRDIGLQAFQALVVSVASSKVINRDATAEISQQLDVMHAGLNIGKHLLLGNFNRYRLCRQVIAFKQSDDLAALSFASAYRAAG